MVALLDASASMEGEKLERARQLAAAVAWVALGRDDRVAVAGVTDALRDWAPPRRGRAAAQGVFRSLEAVRPGGATDLGRALAGLPRQRGATIGLLFTDFLYPEGVEAPLRRLKARLPELHAFHVVAPWEERPELDGDLLLEDAETGEELAVSLDGAARERYAAAFAAWTDEVAATCRRLGVSWHRAPTRAPLEEAALRALREEGVLA